MHKIIKYLEKKAGIPIIMKYVTKLVLNIGLFLYKKILHCIKNNKCNKTLLIVTNACQPLRNDTHSTKRSVNIFDDMAIPLYPLI